MALTVPQPADEADVRRMEVEHADLDATGAEAGLAVRRNREERAGADAVPRAVLEELDLALEDVERVGAVGMGVRSDTLEVRGKEELDRLDVRQLGEHTVGADPFTLAGAQEDRLVHRCRS